MRVAIVGATGNVGTSLIDALARDDAVDSIVGIARRRPSVILPKVEWRSVDVVTGNLRAAFEDADAVVHLAWLIQPARDLQTLWRVNVDGSRRVFEAAHEAGVKSLVYASSIGAYSPGSKDEPVDESWPVDGIQSAYYSRHKATVERLLDEFDDGAMRVVRLRPALIFKRESAFEQQRYFAGPLVPRAPLRRRRLPLMPRGRRLRFQAVHATDVAEAYRLALRSDVSGAFNIAADDVLDMRRIAGLFHARTVELPEPLMRAAADATWRLHLQPSAPGWFDMAVESPLMKTGRAKRELGWQPRVSALAAIAELIDGIGNRSSRFTPPLSAARPIGVY